MTDSSRNEKVQAIIAKNLAELQLHIDEAKAGIDEATAASEARDELVIEATAWEEIPADISDEMLEALVVKGGQFLTLHCQEGFVEKLNEVLKQIRRDEPARYRAIVEHVNEARMGEALLEQNPLEPGTPMLRVFIDEPAEEGGAWTFVAVPVVIGDDYKVDLPASMPFDLQLSLDVKPHDVPAGLTETFNLQATVLPEGAAPAPVVLEYQPETNGAKELHVSGYIRAGNNLNPVYLVEEFHVGPGGKPGFAPDAGGPSFGAPGL